MSDIKKKIANEMSLYDIEASLLGPVWEMKRLQSLKKWTMTKPSVKEMAESGFYCPDPNTPGTVKCFSCFIELQGWEPTDNPWEEHRKRAFSLNPPCKFVEIGKKELDLSIEEYFDILKSIMSRIVMEKCEKNRSITLSMHKKKKTSLRKDLQKLGVSINQ